MIKKFNVYIKKISYLTIYIIIIVYSLELLSATFLKKKHDFTNKTFDQVKNKKILEIDSFDMRGNYVAFSEERERQNLSPSFKYTVLHFFNADHENKIKNFIQNKSKKKEIIPFRGPINKNSLGSNEEGLREIITNDKFGFKNDNSFYENIIDAMILGDSFAEGIPFSNSDSVSGNMNKKTRYNVLNYGVSGSGPLLSLGIVKEYSKKLKPKNVFYLFYEGNDLNDLMIEKKTFLLKYLGKFSQNLFKSTDEVTLFLEEYEGIFNEILPIKIKQEKNNISEIKASSVKENAKSGKEKIKNFLELNTLKEIILPSSVFTKSKIDYSLFLDTINEMNTEVKNWGGNFYFVYLPSWTRYNNKYSAANFFYKNKIENMMEEIDIPFVDIDRVFKKNKSDNVNSYNLGLYGHYTKEGYSLIADRLIKILDEK
tara:strand:+ start:405 stop:1685 length:1281 start_codon:yes stop_codon:yes gene_type:complete